MNHPEIISYLPKQLKVKDHNHNKNNSLWSELYKDKSNLNLIF